MSVFLSNTFIHLPLPPTMSGFEVGGHNEVIQASLFFTVQCGARFLMGIQYMSLQRRKGRLFSVIGATFLVK